MNKAFRMIVVTAFTLGACGCETLPALYLCTVVGEVVDARMVNRKSAAHSEESDRVAQSDFVPVNRWRITNSREVLPDAMTSVRSQETGAYRGNFVVLQESSQSMTVSAPTKSRIDQKIREYTMPRVQVRDLPSPAPVRAEWEPFGSQYPIPESLVTIWQEYRAFRYEAVIKQVDAYSKRSKATSREIASALILAGASAFVLGDLPRARTLLRNAARNEPDIRPSPRVFPSEVCQLHAQALGRRP